MTWTLTFDELRPDDLPRVGGKGVNLGRLASAGLPVPGGFCVTTEAWRETMAEPDAALRDALAQLDEVASGDVEAARSAGAAMRAAITARPLPPALAEEILGAWRVAGEDHAYAVRSSATAEDLPDASFAGQQDTYLNVRGAGDLLDRVRACQASLFTDRAILYRLEQGIPHRDVELSVVVQRMVQPRASGILFTADPLTGHRGLVSIDAGFGLGEALVSGLVSADSCRVRKHDGAVLDYRVGDKGIAIVSLPEGGTRTEELSDARRGERVLSDAEAVELARLGQRIERHFGAPQDIEWALADGELFVLQARPITSLYPVPESTSGDDALGIFLSFNHFQVMTDAMPPLTIDTFLHAMPFGKPTHDFGQDVPSPWGRSAGGRLYIDLSRVLRVEHLRPRVAMALNAVNPRAAAALRQVTARPEFQAGPRVRLRSLVRALGPSVLSALRVLLFRRVQGTRADRTAWLHAYIEQGRRDVERAGPPGSGAALLQARRGLSAALSILFDLPPYILAGYLGAYIARRLSGASEQDKAALSRALEGNITTDMDLAVGDLADVARPYAELVALLRGGEADRAALGAVAGGGEFLAALDSFLERYGMRAPSEIDPSRPRWRDDPSVILRTVAGNLGHAEIGRHRQHHEALRIEAARVQRRLIADARRGPLGWLRGAIARRGLRLFRELAGLREHPKFALINQLDVLRQQVLAAGAALVERGALDVVDDAWFLSIGDLAAAVEGTGEGLKPLIAERRRVQERYAAMSAPVVMTTAGENPQVVLDVDAPEGALVGASASAGVIEGVARVVTDPTSEVLHAGEILVAPFTDPGWTPLFINAAALVMEVGGLMTHGSVIAREYGIPAVVCVEDATTRIHTGDRLLVQGDEGWVQIVERAP